MWLPALDADHEIRRGARVARLTGLMGLRVWLGGDACNRPQGGSPPGVQPRSEDLEGIRIAAFATNTSRVQHNDLMRRRRRRARCKDRIRIAKHTGLTSGQLKSFPSNQIWCAMVALSSDIAAWMRMLALHGHLARRGSPGR